MLRPVNEPPSTSRTVRKTPKTFGGGMRLFNSFEALIKPNQSSWENQLTIPTSTLENLHTQRQSDSKKNCLILKNVWAKSFWDLERIDANDSIRNETQMKGYQDEQTQHDLIKNYEKKSNIMKTIARGFKDLLVRTIT